MQQMIFEDQKKLQDLNKQIADPTRKVDEREFEQAKIEMEVL